MSDWETARSLRPPPNTTSQGIGLRAVEVFSQVRPRAERYPDGIPHPIRVFIVCCPSKVLNLVTR